MLPRATDDLPRLIGRCATKDRSCEEVLLKEPARTGDHHWLKVAKTNLGTQQVRAAIARSVGIDVELVECAGNRDRAGRCVQWFSVPAEAVDHPGPLRRAGVQGKMQVLELTASHKPVTPALVERLRWKLTLRGAAAGEGYLNARRLLDRLRHSGSPNYVALERFGEGGSFARWGRMLLEGRRLPPQVAASGIDGPRCLRAAQEWLFNRYLAARVGDRLLASCLPGEVVRGSRGEVMVVEDQAHGEKRFASWEAVALGPLFGTGMLPAAGEAAAREAAVLAANELAPAQVARLHGERRAIRFQPGKAGVDPAGGDLTLACELPTDAYISELLAEFLAPSPDGAAAAAAAAGVDTQEEEEDAGAEPGDQG
jgi:tRNA pseudouridine13 synthase